MRAVAACCTLVLLTGCSAAADEEDNGGTTPSHREFGPEDSVVAIRAPKNLATWVCSAAVIGPRTILSAAHCFKGGNADKTGWTFEVVVTRNVHRTDEGDLHAPITAFHLPPDYDPANIQEIDPDIAVATT